MHPLLAAADDLCRALKPLRFEAPVTHVYNPLVYARANYAAYVERYALLEAPAPPPIKRVLLLGMNPGPWGMAQTGVPFGDASVVREWLGISGEVTPPADEHPERPIFGLACPRSEVSGTRLWGAIRDHFQTPARFFQRFFVENYCPLCFLEETGRNRTPDRLPAEERAPLYAICDAHLRRAVEILQPRLVIGVGNFAADRATNALEGSGIAVGQILHPSPASPAANVGWLDKVKAQLAALGVCGGA
jgi:single-strand selective monofunctional uracil DNA glycosylase